MAAWMSCCSLSWARNYKHIGYFLIDLINNKARSFGSMQNTVRWLSDWFWYIFGRSWRNNYLVPPPWSNGNWCNLESRFWYINLFLTSKFLALLIPKEMLSSEITAEKHIPSWFMSHLDYLVSKHIKLPLLSVNAERGAVRFANRGSTHLIV
jgi:hypothetical protein